MNTNMALKLIRSKTLLSVPQENGRVRIKLLETEVDGKVQLALRGFVLKNDRYAPAGKIILFPDEKLVDLVRVLASRSPNQGFLRMLKDCGFTVLDEKSE